MSATDEAGALPVEEPKKRVKKPKVRKKALFKNVANQMDFYFGDSNLRQDRFLKKEIDTTADGYIPLELFLKFNKIKQLGVSTEDIAKAVTHFSSILILNEAKDKVKRKTPIVVLEDVDHKIVYLEGLPLTANHDWVNTNMSKYGKVTYVSLPRYPSTKTIKGFAFVEFDTEEGVRSCLSAIGTKEFNQVHPFPKAGSKDIQRMQKAVVKGGVTESPNQKKRNKKRNSASADTIVTDLTGSKVESSTTSEPPSKKIKIDGEIENNTVAKLDGEPPTKPSKKRKRKISQSKTKDEPAEAKSKLQANSQQQNENVEKVVVKPEAKKSKLDLISMETESNYSKKEATTPKGPNLRAISNLQKANMAALKQKLREQNAKEEAEANKASGVEMLEIIPNVLVEVKADNELVREKVKSCLPHGVAISYIDAQVGSNTGVIRCKSCEDAKNLLEETCGEDYKLALIQGDAEKAYWDKLNQQRIDRRNSNHKKSKRSSNKKGTQKVLEQHMKRTKKSTHVLFDDD